PRVPLLCADRGVRSRVAPTNRFHDFVASTRCSLHYRNGDRSLVCGRHLTSLPMVNGFEHSWRKRFGEFAELSDDDAGIAGWSESGLDARFRRFRRLWGERTISGCWIDAGCGAATYSCYI